MMRYDDGRYLGDEDDNDLWDDELEIDSEGLYSPDDSYGGYDIHYDADLHPDKEKTNEDYYSEPDRDPDPEPEPQVPAKQKSEGFFSRSAEEDDREDSDYFDCDDGPAPANKPKTPKLDPEDPDYWIEEDESPISSFIQKTNMKWKWWLALSLTLIVGMLVGWICFLRPHTDQAVKYGYIINMERRGSLIKTFEGTMIPYKELGSPHPLQFHKVGFSVESDSLAAVMKRMMLRCVPVRVEYKEYRLPLMWKGENTMVIIKADSIDPRKILPPEYRR